jgi:hypothetical protein
VHDVDWQSLGTAQRLPEGQPSQAPPPQSMSVSEPFFTESAQVGALQMHRSHTPDWQSEPSRHVQSPQLGHDPPQSTSVSLPLRTPSLHVGEAQRVFVHTPLTQSSATKQCFPV